jgi:hypothetical protein
MSRNDRSESLPIWLQLIARSVERPVENVPAQVVPDPDPQLRLLDQTQPSYARFLRERRESLDEEARQVERANHSEAFPAHFRR